MSALMNVSICLLILCLAAIFMEASEIILTLSSTRVALVCPGGELTFVCSTNRSFIEWNVTIPQSGASRSRLVASGDQSIGPLVVSMKSFDVVINSDSLVEGLTSKLVIANVTADLNGTIVLCTDIGNSRTESSTSMGIIHIINATTHSDLMLLLPEVIKEKGILFGANNITISFVWTQADVNIISYSASAIPPALVRFNGSTGAAVTVNYNTEYNVSFVSSFCGHEYGSSVSFNFNFVKCNDLLFNDSLTVMGYSQPAIVGSYVTFSCPLGMELIGPNSTTCMENGEWEPDPKKLECKADCGPPSPPPNGYIIPHTSELEGASVTVACFANAVEEIQTYVLVCTHQGIWWPTSGMIVCRSNSASESGSSGAPYIIIIVSFTSSFVVFSLLSLIIGIIYCQCKRKKDIMQDEQPTRVIYEDILPRNQDSEQNEQHLDLNQNIAYGPINNS